MRRTSAGYSLGQTCRVATDEARRRGDRKISAEHLVLALLSDPTSKPANVIGCDLDTARQALDDLDHQALRAIGLDATPQPDSRTTSRRGRLPLTPAAKASFQGLPRVAGGRRNLGPEHILLVLLEREPPDPAATLFAALGLEPAVLRARLSAY